ncbi:MAG: nucleotidyl transferase AbiEii/AbiGii toxin family protein [Bacteroidota bacterium]
MNLSEKDYRKLYQLQDKFLNWWLTLKLPFYLTGGTALGRFYLNHRFSEDLDFFSNADPAYLKYIAVLKNEISKKFTVNIQQSLFNDDYTRLFIAEDDLMLKVEFVNDVESYPGLPIPYQFGSIDQPLNILSNKLSAIIGRDEPKDVFDLVHLSLNYSFEWQEIFSITKQKSLINEIDVEQRLFSFPIDWIENVNWLIAPIDTIFFKNSLHQIADDFLLGKTNSLGISKPPIESAKPFLTSND